MTTFEQAAVSLSKGFASRLEAHAQRRTQRQAAGKVARSIGVAARRLVLQAGGLAAFTFAAWTIATPLGLAVGAVAAFILAWLLDG